jgi:hypothetical protein
MPPPRHEIKTKKLRVIPFRVKTIIIPCETGESCVHKTVPGTKISWNQGQRFDEVDNLYNFHTFLRTPSTVLATIFPGWKRKLHFLSITCQYIISYKNWRHTWYLAEANPIPRGSKPDTSWQQTRYLVAANPISCGSKPDTLWRQTRYIAAANPIPCGGKPDIWWQQTRYLVAANPIPCGGKSDAFWWHTRYLVEANPIPCGGTPVAEHCTRPTILNRSHFEFRRLIFQEISPP